MPSHLIESYSAIVMEAAELLNQYQTGKRDFSHTPLPNISLFNQKLCFINFSGADLHEADLRCLDLFGATLTWTNFRNANLTGANLSRANLRGAKLEGADLRTANLRGANLAGIFYDSSTQFPEKFKPHSSRTK